MKGHYSYNNTENAWQDDINIKKHQDGLTNFIAHKDFGGRCQIASSMQVNAFNEGTDR
jgi:hypothetical protein